MEYGSIFGHGAYLGPDFTADYLHRAALIANDLNGSSSQTTQESTIADFKANRYDASSGVLTYCRLCDAHLGHVFEELFGQLLP
jgi:nitric oxide reductase subunit B